MHWMRRGGRGLAACVFFLIVLVPSGLAQSSLTIDRPDPAAMTATLQEGVRLTFGSAVGNIRHLTEMKDRNGNRIRAFYVSGTERLDRVEDTLGTAARFYYNGDGSLQRMVSLGSSMVEVTFGYESKWLQPQFSIPSQGASARLLASVTATYDNKELQQQFAYNDYGELRQVTNKVTERLIDCDEEVQQCSFERDFPLVSYSYATRQFYDPVHGFVEERAVSAKTESETKGGVTDSSNWTFTYEVDQAKSVPSRTVVNDGRRVREYYFHFGVNGRAWSDGLLQRVLTKSLPSANPPSQLLRTEETTWTQDQLSVACIVNPRVTSARSTLENGMSSLREYFYLEDGTGGLRQVDEYGYGGSLMRRTVTQYLHETNPAYAELNLTNLPSSVSVFDGAGMEASRTLYEYDSAPLAGYSGSILNHDTTGFGTSYLSRGNVTAVRRYHRETGRYLASSMRYDVAGNEISTTDPKGNTTAIQYSSSQHYAAVRRTTNPLGHVTEFTWGRQSLYDSNWQQLGSGPLELREVMDPNGVTSARYYYDRLSRRRMVLTNGAYRYYSYDELQFLTTLGSPSGYGYGIASSTGRPTRQEQTDPAAANMVQTVGYDRWGRLAQRSIPHRADAVGASSAYSYDALDRVQWVDTTGMGRISYSYTGNEVVVSSPVGRRKSTYDGLGRLVKVTEEDAQGNLNVDTLYEYDAMDRMTRIVQGAQTRIFTYDSLGRRLSESHPESGTTSYTHDDNGNTVTRTDARGVVMTHSYDGLNRLTARSYSDGTPGATFGYDQGSSNLIGLITNSKGRMTSAWTADGIGYSWSYDTSGRVVEQVFGIDGAAYPASYSYTDSGCACAGRDLMGIAYPGGFQVNYTRDAAGRVTRVGSPISGSQGQYYYVSDVSYASPTGAVGEIEYGNGGQYGRSWFYRDNLGRPWMEVHDSQGRFGRGYSQSFFNYQSNRLSSTERWQGVVGGMHEHSISTFGYDRLGRLEKAGREKHNGDNNWAVEWELAYSYDRYGNMLTMAESPAPGAPPSMTRAFTVDAATNRVTGHTTSGLWPPPTTVQQVHDAAGRIVQAGGVSYLYDGADRLKEVRRVSDGLQQGGYRYDAFGRRVGKTWVISSEHKYGSDLSVYGAHGEVLVEYRTEGMTYRDEWTSWSSEKQTTNWNVMLNGQVVARRYAETNSSGASFGGVELLQRNYLGEISTSWDVDRWGSGYGMLYMFAMQGPGKPFGSKGGTDQFPGHRYDNETGLKYRPHGGTACANLAGELQ